MAYTTIDNPELWFQCKIYTGTGSSHAITLDGDENMQPDLVWGKSRSDTYDHFLFDSVRGTTNLISSNGTAAENDLSSAGVTAFGSDGFTVDGNPYNKSSDLYAAWCWKGGTTSGITTNGSTTITPAGYSFSATSGVSIVKYAGNGTTGAKYPHGLGVAPKMVIVKNLGTTDWWNVHHTSLGSNSEMYLNTTDAAPGTTGNGTTPDSVNIELEGTGNAHNGSSNNYIAYIFGDVQGFSKFGSYKGNGNADGPFIYTGFRPAFFLGKRTNSTGEWFLLDNRRNNSFNPQDRILEPHSASADVSGASYKYDFLSNGIKIRTTSGAYGNGSGDTFIYMAFAEAPFVNSNGVPCNAR